MELFEMEFWTYYGQVCVDNETFQKLNSDYFISGSTEDVKYMRANKEEHEHLKELGVNFNECENACDWFRIIRHY